MNRLTSTRALLTLTVLLASASALAKPIYLTVPRTYGSEERPSIDVAFEAKGPVELRVLRPVDLDAYMKTQADLHRAYEPPPVKHNPGRALSRGFNAVRFPGASLFEALNPGFRRAASPSLAPRTALTTPKPLAQLSEGPERLVGVPPGFKVAHRQWLNLDLGGEDREFDVPGFEEWNGESGFQERQVELEPLPPGIYLVQVVQGRIEGQVTLVVTDLTLQVKQTDGKLLVRAADKSQRPVVGASVKVLEGKGAPRLAKTDSKGEALFETNAPRVWVTATREQDTALVDTDFYSTLAVSPDVFLYTDRPIYRPGDTVKFRGVVRRPDSFLARLFEPRERKVQVTLLSMKDGAPVQLSKGAQTLDAFGSFAGSLAIPAGLPTGVMRVVATLDGVEHQGEARVQEYVKPTFYLEVLAASETVSPGGTIKAKVRARKYAGGAPKNTAYEVFLYRSLLDAPAWVDDAGLGGTGSAVTYGSASTSEGRLSAPERLYSSIAERYELGTLTLAQQQREEESEEKEDDTEKEDEDDVDPRADADPDDPWATAATFDKNGEAELEIAVPALKAGEDRLSFTYTLTVRAQDDQGSFANGSARFYLSPVEVFGSVRTSKKVTRVRDEAKLAVRSTSLSGRPLGEIEGTATFTIRKASGAEETRTPVTFKTGANGVAVLAVPTDAVGTLEAKVSLKDAKGAEWKGATEMLIVGDGKEPVARVPALTLESLGGVLSPGDTAELIALFPDEWGPGGQAAGPVWLTLEGATLHETKLVEHDGTTLVHRFPIEQRFGSAVYASVAYVTRSGRWEERTLPFRIIPTERMLTVNVEPGRLELAPLADQTLQLQVTDHSGSGVRAQVSVGVVDKAIYALQSEFRPHVLDFFYPPTRLNVTSFYSSEFQGLGYGELLARALARGRQHPFAAVKPPTRQAKQDERDTAYWSADVMTDEHGRASVMFRMPSNQTLWTVTALAADASGRFGESTAQFATRGSVQVATALPQFLREGDEATGSVRVAGGGALKGSSQVQLAVETKGNFQAAGENRSFVLSEKAEELMPFKLAATSQGSGDVLIALTGLAEKMQEKRSVPIISGAIQEKVVVSRWGGGELSLEVPAGAKVERLELSLQPSTVDAALASMRELLIYPMGRTDWLVATTLPNVAIAHTLEKVGAIDKLDADSQALLAEAKSRAVLGIHQILDNAVAGGGFSWWQGYNTPSLSMTLVALDGLAHGIDAGLLTRSTRQVRESVAWLEKQNELSPQLDAVRTYVLARIEGKSQAARVRALVQRDELTDPHSVALAVLAADAAGLRKEPALSARLDELISQSKRGYVQLAQMPDELDALYWSYPVRNVGVMATMAHAASMGDLDVAAARRRILEALDSDELSLFDRATTLLHSLWLIEKDAKAFKKLPPPQLAGVKATLKPRGAGLAATLPNDTRKLTVGTFDGVATLTATVSTPIASVKANERGMTLQRKYYALGEGARRPLAAGDSVVQGQEIFVELTLDATPERSLRSAYYRVVDAVPAGFVPLDEDKAYRSAPYQLPLAHEALKRRSLSPQQAIFEFEEPAWWSQSPRVVGYVLRAQFPGKFVIPPAELKDSFAPSVGARTTASSLSITPSARTAKATP